MKRPGEPAADEKWADAAQVGRDRREHGSSGREDYWEFSKRSSDCFH